MSDAYKNFNQMVIDEFRANGGVVSAPVGKPLLLLTTTGAKSGKSHLNPVTFLRDGDQWVIIASKAGQPSNPDWYYNLLANPVVNIELGSGERLEVKATPVANEAERDHLYAEMVKINPGFAEYEKNTTRRIPVVRLQRVG